VATALLTPAPPVPPATTATATTLTTALAGPLAAAAAELMPTDKLTLTFPSGHRCRLWNHTDGGWISCPHGNVIRREHTWAAERAARSELADQVAALLAISRGETG